MSRRLLNSFISLTFGLALFYANPAAAQTCPAGDIPTYSCAGGNCSGGPWSSLSAAEQANTLPSGTNLDGEVFDGTSCSLGNSTYGSNGSYQGSTYCDHTYTLTTSCASPPPSCTELADTSSDEPKGNVPTSICKNSCNANLIPGFPLMELVGEPDGMVNARYEYDGAACNVSETPASTADSPTDGGDGCLSYGGAGNNGGTITVCKQGSGSDNPVIDGTTNPAQNYNAAPDNTCVTGTDGGVVCYTDFAHSTTVPPVPNEGPTATTQPATPTGCVTFVSTDGSTQTTTCQYSQTTTSTSTNYGTSTTGSTTGTTSGATTGTTTGSTSGTTGGTTAGGSGNMLSGGTDCTAPPSCDGDPVACYQAHQDWVLACAYQTPTTTTDVDGVLDATLTPDVATNNGTILPTIGNYDVSQTFNGLLQTGGFCQLQDMTIPAINGITAPINLPLSKANDVVIPTIRILLLAVASMYALAIFAGRSN